MWPGWEQTAEGDDMWRKVLEPSQKWDEYCSLENVLGPDQNDGSGWSGREKCSVLRLAWLNAWVATLVQYLTKRETLDRHRQIIYEESLSRFLPKPVEQLTSNDHAYTNLSEVDSSPCLSTRMVWEFWWYHLREEVPKLNGTWFSQFITKELGTVHACFVAYMKQNGGQREIKKVGFEDKCECEGKQTMKFD